MFASPSNVPINSPLVSFVDEGIAHWNELQTEEWLVDAKQNRTALAFQFLAANNNPVASIQLNSLREGIREASNAADSECPAQKTFDISSQGQNAPTVMLIGNTEGFELNALFNRDGTYLMGPSLWRATIDGRGLEIRPYHEDTSWVRSSVEEQSSRKWPVGEYLSPRFQAIRIYQFIAFVRNLSRTFPDAEQIRFLADYVGLSSRIIRDAKLDTYYSVDRRSSTQSRRVQIDVTVESLFGPGTGDVAALLLNPILRLFDGYQVGAESIRRSVKDLF